MYDSIIANIQRHVILTSEEIGLLVERLRVKKVRRKQYLVTPDEYCRSEHYVNKGCFRAFYVDERGTEHITKFAFEDWWITDLQSFVEGAPATLYIEALEDGEVLQLSRQHMDELFKLVPALNNYFRIVYQRALIAQHHRVLTTISSRADEHYAQLRRYWPTLEQRVPQYMIASYMGVTPEFLSKVRSRVELHRS